ncbi:ABC transporter ATP-binding protein [Candidatus Mycoplasma pogonae]
MDEKIKNDELDFDELTFDDLNLDDMIQNIGKAQNEQKGAEIELVNVSKKYEGNDKYTLEDINLKIKSGTFCIFLGPSGSGKTTILRMIAGLNSITKGDLLFNGKRFNNLSPSERNIAMVFQSYALYPHMNVYNNISFALKIAKERKDIIDQRVKDVAKILKIDNHLYSKPRDLSGGQKQRVAIGRAIVRKPSTFLMDEPLSNLDAKLREKMRRELVEIHRMLKTTSIYVTHDQLEAMTMGDQIVVINESKIQQDGTSKELYFHPKNIFVAKFIGSPTMNLFKGEIINKHWNASEFNWKIKLSPEMLKLVKEGQKVVLGFRSEDVKIIQDSKNPSLLKGKISNIEPLGKDQTIIVNVNTDIEFVSTTLNNINFNLYDMVHLDFDYERAHFFDEKTEERIN